MSTDTKPETTTDPAKQEPTGVQRLRLARERTAALRAADPTPETTAKRVEVGDVVHAVNTGLQIHRSASLWGGDPALMLKRGDSFIVTQGMLEADLDRNGKPSWSILVHDPDAQYAKWGKLYLAPGEAPADMEPWIPGDADWKEAREAARQAAWRIADEAEQKQAFQEIRRKFGPAR